MLPPPPVCELVENAVLRGRFCELFAPWAGLSNRRSDLFLMGMFSLLDVMAGRPLDELPGELCLAEDVRGALLGDVAAENPLTRIYQLILACEVTDHLSPIVWPCLTRIYLWILACERAEWNVVSLLARQVGCPAEVVSDLYLQAVGWSEEIFHAGGLASRDR